MADVAKAAGVSTMTVSRALRGDPSVTKERRAHIVMTAERMGYILDRGASQLRTRKTGFVAVTVPSINNPNFADSVRGLTAVLEENGLQVLLGFTDYDIEREELMISQLLRRQPEALVLTGSTHTSAAREMLARTSIPVIETWDEPDQPLGYSVGFSNTYAGALMAQHLIDTGCREIAFVGCTTGTDYRGEERARGFMEALKKNGAVADRYIEAGLPPLGAQAGAEAVRKILENYPKTDAVMCVADSVAFGAMTELQRAGINVPGQIAIAGFGAYDVSEFCSPSITTINPNAHEIGKLTGEMIANILSTPSQAATIKHQRSQPILIKRGSTVGH
ncbi:MAG: substrate-binding domain-containing protein [Pseudomonadota bacterium]